MKLIDTITRKPIRWNKPNPIYQIPIESLIVGLLGPEITVSDYEKILRLETVKTYIDTMFTLSINDLQEQIIIQKLNGHQKGRDCCIIRTTKAIKYIKGDDFRHEP